jgi:enoyl-CoA hydratase/carnithine racemase
MKDRCRGPGDSCFAFGRQIGAAQMKDENTTDVKQDFYLVERLDDVAIIRLGKNFLFESIDRAVKHPLLNVFDDISKNDEVKVLVITNCPEKTVGDEYIAFCQQAIATEFDFKSIHRICNVFDQLILKIIGLNKVVVHADCGEIIPLFLNISLACDYRIVATQTVYQKPYLKIGLLPKGGGAFFLCNMLGYAKARELLMSDENLSAQDALELGIVDRVVPHKTLEETALQIAKNFALRKTRSLAGLKRLIHYSMKDLEGYLKFETQELMKLIGTF